MNNGGNFINGLINGNRIFKNNNGEMYNERFFNGKKHGFGKFFDKNGNLLYSWYWNMDKFVGDKIVA